VEAQGNVAKTIAGEEKLRLQLEMIRESVRLNRENLALKNLPLS
jgi:hypothetical protein